MRRFFLSYNSQDLALMQAFEAALRRKDADARFFFAPKSLRAGGFWLPELAEGIAEATVFVLLVGESWTPRAGGGARPGELWRHTAPYRGLYAMTESDADYFFGRSRETAEVISALATTPDKLPILLGNSGVGKSSLAQAGVLAALMRQAWSETVQTERADFRHSAFRLASTQGPRWSAA